MPTTYDAQAVDKILLPGTPSSVRERYRTLAQRAEQVSFSLLEEDIVMLDTETTGLSFRHCDLIEIAAARISGREVVDRFQTFVHPTGPIPAEIQELTGIRDLDVTDAPAPEEAVAALAEFVGGSCVVAHNANFDRTFIERVPGGKDVSGDWVDSLVLSRISLPRLKTHRLADMAQAFGCSPVTHRAMADVDALCGMWRIFLLGLADLPPVALQSLAGMHTDVDWPYRSIFTYLAAEQMGAGIPLKDVRRMLVNQGVGHKRMDAMDLVGEGYWDCEAIPADELTQAFRAGGLVSSMYDSYETRPEQVQMSLEVREAVGHNTYRALEAGTGVGKSVAYLLPAILYAQHHNVTVGVATKTNSLTDQLIQHELPALDAALTDGVAYTGIKGYDRYPCLRNLELSLVRDLPLDRVTADGRPEDEIQQDMLNALATVMAYSCQSAEGDLDALGIRWRSVPRDMLATTHTECTRTRCPYYPHECFCHGARRRAASADVVVTNHALLLRNISAGNGILPPIRHWIVDEAHSFEQEARRQWATELSAEAANRAFLMLGGTRTGAIHALMVEATKIDGSTLVQGLLTKASSLVQRAQVASSDLLTHVHDLNALAGFEGGYNSTTLWINDDVRASDEWVALENSAAAACGVFEQAVKALQEAQDALAQELPQAASELAPATRALAEVLAACKLIVLEPDEGYVYSAELYRATRNAGRERLVAEKLDIGSDLVEQWYPEALSVTYTSATMAVGNNFDHFNHSVGLDQLPSEKTSTLAVGSSFDFDANMSVIVARDMPEPNNRAYLQALGDLLYDVHRSMGGSVLTLFTNRREMERVYEVLEPRLGQIGLELECQRWNSSPQRLRQHFMEKETLSLFALKSFWEGFDAAGSTLRCVVIAKLPFASPRDPLVRERELREDRSWWRYSLPEAVLSVKQAAGRLIRTATDTGVLVIADSRVATKRYGQTFVRALPTTNVSKLERASVGRYITLWRKTHE